LKAELVKRIKKLFSAGELKKAMELSKALDEDKATSYLSRFNTLQADWDEGVMSYDDFRIAKNKLSKSFSNFISNWKLSEPPVEGDVVFKSTNNNKERIQLNIDFKDSFLNNLEHFLHQQPEYMPGNIKAKVWSLVFLDWQIKELNRLKAELSPHNFAQLIGAIDELENQCRTLLEVMHQSGNGDSNAYDAAILMDENRVSLRSSLESIDPDDWTLEVGISKLQQSIDDLIYELEEKRGTAFQFSSN